MNTPNDIDRFDEVLRLIYLDQIRTMSAEQLQEEFSRILDSDKEILSASKEKTMMSRLAALMQQPSLGQLIEQAFQEGDFEEKLLAEKTGLTPSVIDNLRKDSIYP